MLTIYIVRHGQTEWNKARRLQGRQNSPLTSEGVLNAEKLGNRLQTIAFETVYVSPSGRAIQTLEAMEVSLDSPVHILDELDEISFGVWEGKAEDEIERMDVFETFWSNPSQFDHRLNNGEAMLAFTNRVSSAMQHIIQANMSGNVLVVTHGMVIQAILREIREANISELWFDDEIEGTSLTVIEYSNNQYKEVAIGDISHQLSETF